MLAHIRTFLNTAAARVLFGLLIVSFVLFGVANVAQNWRGETQLATVGERRIEPAQFQEAFRRNMARVSQARGNAAMTPMLRQAVAGQTLQTLVAQSAVEGELQRLGLTVPDAAVRQTIFGMQGFQGQNGGFDRARFDAVMRQNNLTEARYVEGLRSDLGQQQLLEAVQAGAAVPDVMLKEVFAFQHEQRVGEVVELPFNAAPTPPVPTEAEMRDAYDNDPRRYSVPAFRRIKGVILSPDTMARHIDVPEADIQAYYDQHKSEFGTPEKRSLDVLVAQDEDLAKRLAAQWTGGADWAAMQKAAGDAGGTAAQLDDVGRADIPGTELAEAAFKAPVGAVTGPVKSAFGWQVFRVLKVDAGSEQTVEAAHDQIRSGIAHERALDEMPAQINKLEDALSAGTTLDDLPGELGVAAITGTLDAQGNTDKGEPAPVPGSPALRQAFIASAFAAGRNDPPHMIEGPEQSVYALAVEDETPAQLQPFDAVQDKVRENMADDARRRAQEVVAAKLLSAVKAGGSLDDAATVAGVRTERTPPMDRPGRGTPPGLAGTLFALKLNDGTMLETPDGFIVVKLVEVVTHDPGADPVGTGALRTELLQGMGRDLELTYDRALVERARPTVNQSMLENLSQ